MNGGLSNLAYLLLLHMELPHMGDLSPKRSIFFLYMIQTRVHAKLLVSQLPKFLEYLIQSTGAAAVLLNVQFAARPWIRDLPFDILQ